MPQLCLEWYQQHFPHQRPGYILAGLGHILAVVAIVIDKKAKLATMLLGIMLLSFALLVHFGGFMDGDQGDTANFLKATSLAGAAFFMSSKLSN